MLLQENVRHSRGSSPSKWWAACHPVAALSPRINPLFSNISSTQDLSPSAFSIRCSNNFWDIIGGAMKGKERGWRRAVLTRLSVAKSCLWFIWSTAPIQSFMFQEKSNSTKRKNSNFNLDINIARSHLTAMKQNCTVAEAEPDTLTNPSQQPSGSIKAQLGRHTHEHWVG